MYILPQIFEESYLCARGNVAVHEVYPRRDNCWLKTISKPPYSAFGLSKNFWKANLIGPTSDSQIQNSCNRLVIVRVSYTSSPSTYIPPRAWQHQLQLHHARGDRRELKEAIVACGNIESSFVHKLASLTQENCVPLRKCRPDKSVKDNLFRRVEGRKSDRACFSPPSSMTSIRCQ